MKSLKILCFIAVSILYKQSFAQDLQADNMLMFQRDNGGWPKHYEEKEINFTRVYTTLEKATIGDEVGTNDATIDNNATTKEIKYLLKTYKTVNNPQYLTAATNGVKYLLKAQYANGGWPQYYPDFSLYRSQITFNDNAMMNVMNVLQDVANQTNDMELLDKSLVKPSAEAVEKGIDCILKTQLKSNGKLVGWCQQYNAKSLKPEMARKFELVGISASETVGIVEFLMKQPNQTQAIKESIMAAVEWLDKSKIVGYKFTQVDAPDQPKGKDKVLVADANSTIWARYYDIETNQPFFSGRDSIKKYKVGEIEYERRNGYAWYGVWPADLLAKKYPKWLEKNK
jgi:PelA/Pel-15E family pectate lyase